MCGMFWFFFVCLLCVTLHWFCIYFLKLSKSTVYCVVRTPTPTHKRENDDDDGVKRCQINMSLMPLFFNIVHCIMKIQSRN